MKCAVYVSRLCSSDKLAGNREDAYWTRRLRLRVGVSLRANSRAMCSAKRTIHAIPAGPLKASIAISTDAITHAARVARTPFSSEMGFELVQIHLRPQAPSSHTLTKRQCAKKAATPKRSAAGVTDMSTTSLKGNPGIERGMRESQGSFGCDDAAKEDNPG